MVTLVLALGLGGVALAQRGAGSARVDVTILDGRLKVSPTTFAAGKVTLVVVNRGKLSHALAIMGSGLQPKRTATIRSGKTARLTVTVKAGMYHVWDPVRSSMSHATMLKARAPAASSSSPSTGTQSPGATGTQSSGAPSGTSTGPTGTTSGGDGMPGMTMDECEHM